MTTSRDRLRRAVAAVSFAHMDHQAALKAFVEAPLWTAAECGKTALETAERLRVAVRELVEAEMMMDRADG